MVSEGGCLHQNNKKCGRPFKFETTSSETRNEEEFFSNRVVEAWNAIPGDIKRSKTVSSFKNAYKNHRENMVENA